MKPDKPLTYEDISYIHIYLYKIIGFLPFDNNNILAKYFPVVYFHVMNVIYYSMHTTNTVRVLVRDGFVIDYIFESIFVHGIFLRFMIIYYHRADLLELMKICGKLWLLLVGEEGKIVKIYEKKVRYLMHYFAWTTFAAIVFYMVTAQVVRIPPETGNGTETRMLPFRFYVDVQEQPWYEIVSIFQDIVCCSYALVITAIESMGPFLIMMSCGYLRTVSNRLSAMTWTPSNDIIKNNTVNIQSGQFSKLSLHDIKECANFHQQIMAFCQKIENFTRDLFIIQILCTVYNMSLICFRILEHDPNTVRYIPMLFLNLLQFFTCQWISEYLINESKAIGDAAYSVTLEHPEYESEANRILLYMMMRTQKPVQMTAGGYINLSLETFKRMLMSAISFFTVLRTMSN